MPNWTRRLAISAMTAWAGLVGACADPPHPTAFQQSADGMTAYFGVVPSELLGFHAPEHPESAMHGSPKKSDFHLVVALYDDASGARIEDAVLVEAVIRGESHRASRRIRLEPMPIENSVTYGGYAALTPIDRYHVSIEIQRPVSDRKTKMKFLFDGRDLPRGDI